MRNLIYILICSLSIYSYAQENSKTEETKDITFHRSCRKADNKPCVSLDFNTTKKDIIVSERKIGGDTEYTLKLFGKLNKEAEKEHQVKFIGSPGSCTQFGKGTVGVLGFSSAGNPIVLIDDGSFEITSKFITVGAANLQIVNLNDSKRTLSLSRSVHTDPYFISRIHFNSSGDVFLLDGTECFQLRKNALFRKVDIKRCESKKTEVKDTSVFEKIKLKSNQKAYELKDSSTVLLIDVGSC